MITLGWVHTIKRSVGERGFKKTLFLVANHIFEKIFHYKYYLFEIYLPSYSTGVKNVNNDVHVSPIISCNEFSTSQFDDVINYGGYSLLSQLENRLKAGYKLFAGLVDGKVAGVCLVLTRDVKRFDIVPISDRAILITQCFTIPRYRGMGLYPTILSYTLELYRTNGYTQAYIACSTRNRASVRGIEKAGFSKLGHYYNLSIFNRNMIIW